MPPGRGDHQRHGECHLEDTGRARPDGRRLAPTEPGHPDEIAVCLEEGHAGTLPARHAGIDEKAFETALLGAAPGHEAIAAPPGPNGEPRRDTVRVEGDGVAIARHDVAGAGLETARLEGGADLGQRQGSRHHEFARLEIRQAASPHPQPSPALLDDQPARAHETARDVRGQETAKGALAGPAHRPGVSQAQGRRAQRLGGDLARKSPKVGDAEDPARSSPTAQAGELALSRSLEVVHERAHEARRAGEPRRDAGIHRALEERQHVVAHAIAQEARISIARVVHPGEPAGAQMDLDVGPPRLEQRPDQEAADGRDSREPTGPRALEEPHEHRLRLIVVGVRGGDALGADALCNGPEGAVAGAPGLGLEPFPGRFPTDRDALHVAGHTKLAGQSLDGELLGIRLGAESVVDVDEVHLQVELGTEAHEHVGQRDGVGASRDGSQDSFAAPEHSGAAKGGPNERDETTVARGCIPPGGLPTPLRPRSTPSSTPAPSS